MLALSCQGQVGAFQISAHRLLAFNKGDQASMMMKFYLCSGFCSCCQTFQVDKLNMAHHYTDSDRCSLQPAAGQARTANHHTASLQSTSAAGLFRMSCDFMCWDDESHDLDRPTVKTVAETGLYCSCSAACQWRSQTELRAYPEAHPESLVL